MDSPCNDGVHGQLLPCSSPSRAARQIRRVESRLHPPRPRQAARSEAADADATRDASPALREATRRALDHLTRFEKAGGDQNPMLAVYDRALEEERAG